MTISGRFCPALLVLYTTLTLSVDEVDGAGLVTATLTLDVVVTELLRTTTSFALIARWEAVLFLDDFLKFSILIIRTNLK